MTMSGEERITEAAAAWRTAEERKAAILNELIVAGAVADEAQQRLVGVLAEVSRQPITLGQFTQALELRVPQS